MARVEVRPEVLRWARERSGLADDAFAKKCPQFDSWESGLTRPTLKQLKKFAHDTYAPLSYMFLERPPEQERPIADFRTVSGLRRTGFSPHLLDTIYQSEWRQEWYKGYKATAGEDPVSFIGARQADDSPEDAAARLRDELNVKPTRRGKSWDDAVRVLLNDVEAAGVLVMRNGVVGNNTHRKLDSDEFRGFALSDPMAPLIFINGADTLAAQSFTIAHELGHLYRGDSGVSNAEAGSVNEGATERWCNEFAAEFLIPSDEFARQYDPDAQLESELKRLARLFKVSSLVILRRMYSDSALTHDEFRLAYARELNAARAGMKTRSSTTGGGNFYHTLTRRLSRRFARAVITSVLEGQTSFIEGLDLLSLKRSETFYQYAQYLGFNV